MRARWVVFPSDHVLSARMTLRDDDMVAHFFTFSRSRRRNYSRSRRRNYGERCRRSNDNNRRSCTDKCRRPCDRNEPDSASPLLPDYRPGFRRRTPRALAHPALLAWHTRLSASVGGKYLQDIGANRTLTGSHATGRVGDAGGTRERERVRPIALIRGGRQKPWPSAASSLRAHGRGGDETCCHYEVYVLQLYYNSIERGCACSSRATKDSLPGFPAFICTSSPPTSSK